MPICSSSGNASPGWLQFPELGRSIAYLRRGYFRFEHKSDTVFYVRSGEGIRVVRVLHERMDPERHL